MTRSHAASDLKQVCYQHYPPALVDFVQGCIMDAMKGTRPPMSCWLDAEQAMEAEQIPYVKNFAVDEVLVHEMNRGSLGINPHSAHSNGAKIIAMGVDPKELEKATCFERMPHEPQRSQQISFNQKLIDASGGLMAKLFGVEKVASVGTGHCTQFFRASKQRCLTHQKTLQDADGRLNDAKFRDTDPRFKRVQEHGYEWKTYPWQAQATWPLLPDLAQRALNAA